MTKKKTRNELIMENFLKVSEMKEKTDQRREKRINEEHDSLLNELYGDWGKYKDGDDDFRDNMK